MGNGHHQDTPCGAKSSYVVTQGICQSQVQIMSSNHYTMIYMSIDFSICQILVFGYKRDCIMVIQIYLTENNKLLSSLSWKASVSSTICLVLSAEYEIS